MLWQRKFLSSWTVQLDDKGIMHVPKLVVTFEGHCMQCPWLLHLLIELAIEQEVIHMNMR
jgi:flagellar biosynthesis protein FliQ